MQQMVAYVYKCSCLLLYFKQCAVKLVFMFHGLSVAIYVAAVFMLEKCLFTPIFLYMPKSRAKNKQRESLLTFTQMHEIKRAAA